MRKALIFLLATTALVALLQMARAFRMSAGEFHPARERIGPPPPGLPGAATVAIPSRAAVRLAAWWVPSRNGATIVLLHGSGGDRRQMLPEAQLLAAGGFGVVALDLPGTGESGGSISWGRTERAAILGVLDWLAARAPRELVGVLGFSMGATMVVPVAAEDRRIRALILEGIVDDLDEQTNYEYRRWGPFTQLPARAAKRYEGYDPSLPLPLAAVKKLDGRPLLIIAGTNDRSVPIANSQRLFEAASPPREFWLIEGAQHGDYLRTAGEEYRRRVLAFFEGALLGSH